MKIVFAFCLTFFLSAALYSQDSLSVPHSVNYVFTGGAWKTKTAHGYYRIIVYDFGWEHIYSKLKIEWFEETVDPDKPPFYTYAYIKEINDGMFSLSKPEFLPDPNETMLRVAGTNPYTLEEKSWLILLEGPGQYSVTPGKPVNSKN